MEGLKKRNGKYYFQDGPYSSWSLDEVVADYGGRGWLLEVTCGKGMYPKEDRDMIQKAYDAWYIKAKTLNGWEDE